MVAFILMLRVKRRISVYNLSFWVLDTVACGFYLPAVTSNSTHRSRITLKHHIRLMGELNSLYPHVSSLFWSQLIPEPLPFPHHVLVMSCEAIFRVKVWSSKPGGCDEGLDGPVLYNMQ